ncbi:MAG TPA: F0F1 ATP synthase subunit B [Longimicrobiales bacterium]|nr:F0F1 ATP synthase subunit B [Longimicrobiales bacterium]
MELWALIQEAGHAAEEAAGQAAEHAPNVFNLNMVTSFWTLVIFGVLMAVLAKWAFPPILGYAQAREDRIQKSLDEARQAREEAARALEEQRRDLAKAREESQAIIAQGKQDAELVRQELLERARAEQEGVVEKARREIEREREQAVESIRREAVEISIAAAAHLVGKTLDGEEDRRLVREYLAHARTTPMGGEA